MAHRHPNLRRVQYRQVYLGIDVVYYGNQGQLENDFVLAPGADPSLIRLTFEGTEQVRLEDTGALLVQVAGAELRQAPPVVYQERPDGRQAVAGGYTVNEHGEIGFVVGAYDATRPLIIDPVLVYSTYLGGSDGDQGSGIAVDVVGNAYVTGFT